MKKLIICCDGTWNTAEQKDNDIPAPTNVVRFYNALSKTDRNGTEQRKYYHPGVGTEGSIVQKIAGGAYGLGISKNIMSGYRWLADNYETGDLIYLFGFSRGAYTARSLAGFIGACGVPDLTGMSPDDGWNLIQKAYDTIYRVEKDKRPAISWARRSGAPDDFTIPVQMVGVWDTVGALGIPDDLALLNLFDDPAKWMFHDTQLGDHVRYARHAVAIDEMRASFTPTLWTDANDQVLNDGDRVKQLWFAGVHSDVGGGYAMCDLSNLALDWMREEAVGAGLEFEDAFVQQMSGSAQGMLHDSLGGLFKNLRTRPRNRPLLVEGSAAYHASAWLREKAPPIAQSPYHHPSLTLAPNQSSDPIDIYARNHWNETGIFLEENATYEFTATGQWIDGTIPSGPEGNDDGEFHIGEIVQMAGSLLGKLEVGFQKLTGNTQADFMGTKRVETAPWFSLIGVVANDGPQAGRSPHPDGSAYAHLTFPIGAHATLTIKPTEAGYLYAYANDAWHFYDNNRGSISLTVKRIA